MEITGPWRAAFGAMIGLYCVFALLEILVPARVIRWRKGLIEQRRGRFGSGQVADFFDQLTGERAHPDAWSVPSVRFRVRVIGLVNLLLAGLFAFVLLRASR
jgi:hypothetical protein